jgi:hypothetical protein
MRAQFPVVCICGSTRFEQETKQMAESLTLAGQIVLMVNVWSKKGTLHEPQNPIDEEIKIMLDALHKEKIRIADYVLVMNVGGYWGKSTQSEINFANRIGKPVKYIEPLVSSGGNEKK